MAETRTLVERLRAWRDYEYASGEQPHNDLTEAADTIERQAREIERLREALAFYDEPSSWSMGDQGGGRGLTIKDRFARPIDSDRGDVARRALDQGGEP